MLWNLLARFLRWLEYGPATSAYYRDALYMSDDEFDIAEAMYLDDEGWFSC